MLADRAGWQAQLALAAQTARRVPSVRQVPAALVERVAQVGVAWMQPQGQLRNPAELAATAATAGREAAPPRASPVRAVTVAQAVPEVPVAMDSRAPRIQTPATVVQPAQVALAAKADSLRSALPVPEATAVWADRAEPQALPHPAATGATVAMGAPVAPAAPEAQPALAARMVPAVTAALVAMAPMAQSEVMAVGRVTVAMVAMERPVVLAAPPGQQVPASVPPAPRVHLGWVELPVTGAMAAAPFPAAADRVALAVLRQHPVPVRAPLAAMAEAEATLSVAPQVVEVLVAPQPQQVLAPAPSADQVATVAAHSGGPVALAAPVARPLQPDPARRRRAAALVATVALPTLDQVETAAPAAVPSSMATRMRAPSAVTAVTAAHRRASVAPVAPQPQSVVVRQPTAMRG